MYKNVEKQTKIELKDLVSYQEGQVVSKTLVQNDYVSMTIEEVDTEYAKAIEKGVRSVLEPERVNISGTAVGASGMVAGVIVRGKQWYF